MHHDDINCICYYDPTYLFITGSVQFDLLPVATHNLFTALERGHHFNYFFLTPPLDVTESCHGRAY